MNMTVLPLPFVRVSLSVDLWDHVWYFVRFVYRQANLFIYSAVENSSQLHPTPAQKGITFGSLHLSTVHCTNEVHFVLHQRLFVFNRSVIPMQLRWKKKQHLKEKFN